MTTGPPESYRLAPAFVARLVGLGLVALALVLFAGTALVALGGLAVGALPAAALVGVGVILGLGSWLGRTWVLRCTDEGYRVRLVRGAGVTEARWSEVEDAVTAYRRGVACLELRLRDGRTTTVPAGVLAVDRERLVQDVQERLQQGHGLRPA